MIDYSVAYIKHLLIYVYTSTLHIYLRRFQYTTNVTFYIPSHLLHIKIDNITGLYITLQGLYIRMWKFLKDVKFVDLVVSLLSAKF